MLAPSHLNFAALTRQGRASSLLLTGWLSRWHQAALCDPASFCLASTGDIAPLGSLPLPAAITSVAVTSPNPAVTTDSRTGGTGQNVLSVITPSTNSNLAPSSQQPTGIILSPALQPIPARLVRRIQEGEFLEMRELLADNIALHDQLEAIQGPVITQATPGSLRPRLREIPSITSWMYCFAAYVAVRTTDPATRQMLAYARLIIREALHHGGSGWQDYDRCFRQQAAIDRSLPWNVLLPGLQSATILGQRTPGGAHCSLCRGVEHTATQCALTCMQQQPGQAFFTPLASRRQVQLRQRDGRLQDRICGSWNSGSCIYPRTCSYRHVCATCHQNHRARDCPDRPEGSRHRPGQPGTSQGSNTSGRNQTSRAT